MSNIFIEAMALNTRSIASIIPTTMIFAVAVLATIGAFKGFRRGISRQIIRTLTIVASAVISFILSTTIYMKISEYLDGKTVADIEGFLIGRGILTESVPWLYNFDIHTIKLIFTLPTSLIILPLIFVISFISISSAMLIVHVILCAIFGFRKRRNNFLTRLLGMALGFIQGVAVAGLILMPVIGLSSSASNYVTALKAEPQKDTEDVQLIEAYDEYIRGTAENPITLTLGKYGINSIYTQIATVHIDGKAVDTTAEIHNIIEIISEARSLSEADPKNLTPENEAAINRILDTVAGSDYLTDLLAGSVNALSHSYTDGHFNVSINEPFESIIDSAVSIFHTSDSTNIHSDLDTVKNVFFILSRDGILNSFDKDSDAMLDALTARDASGETTVNRVVNTINQNERTKPLVTLLTKLSVTVMSQKAGISEDALQTYDNIKASINEDILSIKKSDYSEEEEYIAEVSTALDNTLKENNITVEKEIVDNMAKYFADNYSDTHEISDDEANDIILSYYDAYLDYLENGTIPEGIIPPVTE